MELNGKVNRVLDPVQGEGSNGQPLEKQTVVVESPNGGEKPCDCMERIEKLLTEKMMEKYPDGDVVEEVAFVNKTLTFDNKGHSSVILANPGLGKVRVGKAIRKFDTRVFPTYCPFCGKKIR